MHLESLSIINFKNIKEATFECSERINCFVGDNGTGKTNLLDAIHYLSLCKSNMSTSDVSCIMHHNEMFLIDGRYISDSGRGEQIKCGLKRGETKKMSRSGKEYEKLADHIGLIPLVMITPLDNNIITDGGEIRRKFMNAIISQFNAKYLSDVMKYNQLLASRNKLLKSQGTANFREIMEVLDMQLSLLGHDIHRCRCELIEQMQPIVTHYYSILSNDREKISVSYKSDLNDTPFDKLLRDNYTRDTINMYTTTGIHRDDIVMAISDSNIRRYGSQGQQKSFLIALKLAQYDIMHKLSGQKPILIMDDIFDKLDMMRVTKLIEIVSQPQFKQIFISDCNKVRLESILKNNDTPYTLFNVNYGEVSQL